MNEKDPAAKELDNIEARNKRIQNFHAAAEEATKIQLGDNDKDIESLLKEVKGTNILVKLNCSEIVGFPAITTDLKINGLIEVALSIEEGEINPKLSFFVVKGEVDVTLSEYFALIERTCCLACCNYSAGGVQLDYQQSRNATSQFSTLPVEGTVFDATCYSNEDVSFKTKSRTSDLAITCTECLLSCLGCCMLCANCKCCDCITCCSCPTMDRISNYSIFFRAKDSRLIGVQQEGPKVGTATVIEHGLRFDVTKSFEKSVYVVFYYRSPLDNKPHKCSLKLADGDFLNAKRFVNLIGKYRSKSNSTLIDHSAIQVNPVGLLAADRVNKFNLEDYLESAKMAALAKINK